MTDFDPTTWGAGDKRRLRRSLYPPAVLMLIDLRQGGRHCVNCRVQEPEQALEVDHKQPLSRGGDNHHLNLQWMCVSCNRGRGARKAAPTVPKWKRRKGRGLSLELSYNARTGRKK